MRCSWILCAALLASCSDDTSGGTQAVFDYRSAHDTPETFWDVPFPLDTRLTDEGAPNMEGFFTKGENTVGEVMVEGIDFRRGFAQVPVIYFRFDAPLSATVWKSIDTPTSPIVLIDIDEDSPDYGTSIPVTAEALPVDDFAPLQLLGVSPQPGWVLRHNTTYAAAVLRHINDENGDAIRRSDDFAALVNPERNLGDEIEGIYAPLWPVLEEIGLDRDELVNAAVFTTGDVVGDFATISDALMERHSGSLANPTLVENGIWPDYCELSVDLTVPQFMTGNEPWNRGGIFDLDSDGIPKKQGDRTVPATITIPRGPMPATGYPLMLYFHGSGGVHDQVADASRSPAPGVDGPEGAGPAMHYARIGFAAAGAALPVSPDRVPGASDIAYINFQNLKAFPFLFRQGVIEQRMFLTALAEMQLDPEVLGECTGPELPEGETTYFFDPDQLYAGGQSMGGMYTNMFGAIDPRPRALVPTGAGGNWTTMILRSSLFEDQVGLLALVIGTPHDLRPMHPGLHTLEIAWEAAEPLVYVPRISRRPLAGRTPRPIYEPAGKDDGYFATPIFDAMALAYGHQQAGEVIWPEMQESLALAELDGIIDYPVSNNLMSESGEAYTGVVVQYLGDGIADPHAIYRQRDEVIYQFSCFLSTMRDHGVAVVPAPAALGTECPAP